MAKMSLAVRGVSVERGYDPRDFALIAFGGAAPVHAARLAEKLGIATVIVPTDAGVGSAVGFLLAPVAYEVVRSRHQLLSRFDAETTNRLMDEMNDEALAVIRQAMDTFAVERATEEILDCLASFGEQWDRFSTQIDKVDKHLGTLTNSFGELSGPRRRMLEQYRQRPGPERAG